MCDAVVIRIGDRENLLETIWFHPDETTKVKYVHWVPEQSEETQRKCWRRKK